MEPVSVTIDETMQQWVTDIENVYLMVNEWPKIMELLNDIEFNGFKESRYWGTSYGLCPCCKNPRKFAHAPDCRIGKLLSQARKDGIL